MPGVSSDGPPLPWAATVPHAICHQGIRYRNECGTEDKAEDEAEDADGNKRRPPAVPADQVD